MSAAEAGALLSVLTVGLIAGIIVEARIGDRLIRGGDLNRRVVFVAACFVLQFMAYVPMFTADSLLIVVAATAAVALFTGLPIASATTMSRLDVFVSHLRGRAAALHAIVPVVAMGAGPLVFGILSDAYGLRDPPGSTRCPHCSWPPV